MKSVFPRHFSLELQRTRLAMEPSPMQRTITCLRTGAGIRDLAYIALDRSPSALCLSFLICKIWKITGSSFRLIVRIKCDDLREDCDTTPAVW